MPAGKSTLRIGSRAAATREPRQVRKEAAISAARRVPRIGLIRAGFLVGHADVPVDGGCTANQCTLRFGLPEAFKRCSPFNGQAGGHGRRQRVQAKGGRRPKLHR